MKLHKSTNDFSGARLSCIDADTHTKAPLTFCTASVGTLINAMRCASHGRHYSVRGIVPLISNSGETDCFLLRLCHGRLNYVQDPQWIKSTDASILFGLFICVNAIVLGVEVRSHKRTPIRYSHAILLLEYTPDVLLRRYYPVEGELKGFIGYGCLQQRA